MRRFGLIGFPLGHSFSQKFFTEKFQREGIQNCSYQNFPLSSIDQLKDLLTTHSNLEGFNITIPYKEQVLAFVDEQTDAVQKIGACNCVKIVNGKLVGYNTDVKGFEVSLRKKLEAKHNTALVLGTGGAAKAVVYALQQLNISYKIVSRNANPEANVISYAQLTKDIIASHKLIVNTTPLGTYPNVNECADIPYEALTPNHYLFDLVYNPSKTLFLQKGEAQGATIENGHEMLEIQAEESWKIWDANK
jgi:shikimate dehydrogenase